MFKSWKVKLKQFAVYFNGLRSSGGLVFSVFRV